MTATIQTAQAYHRATSYERNRMTPHHLDWSNQPQVKKRYPPLPRIPLDRSVKLPEMDFFSLGGEDACGTKGSSFSTDIEKISALLRLTHDITLVAMHGGGPFYYRSVASAGALYPFEVYLVAYGIRGLDRGVYHYDLFDYSLTVLRESLPPAFKPVPETVAATFYISGIFFRSAWKYRSRAYRYVLLDAGHLIENLRLALKGLHLPFDIDPDFEDDSVASLLGLDPKKEACLTAVHLYRERASKTVHAKLETFLSDHLSPMDPRILEASVVAEREVDYNPILEIHHAGKNITTAPVVENILLAETTHREPSWFPLDFTDPPGGVSYGKILQMRRSHRNFIPAVDAGDDLKLFIGQLLRHTGHRAGVPLPCQSSVTIGLLIGEGMGVAPGFYLLDAHSRQLGRVAKGLYMEPMARACLDQSWLKQAAVHLLFLTDLSRLDRHWGARGYRYAMLEAGRLGQLAYLAATAIGWGACGIGAIYDRQAAQLLNLSDSEALLYLVGVGPVRKRKRRQ